MAMEVSEGWCKSRLRLSFKVGLGADLDCWVL